MIPSSRIESLLRSVRELSEPIRVSGTTTSARSWICTSLARESSHLWVILCPNDEAASEFTQDAELWNKIIPGTPLPIFLLPSWERSPYGSIAPAMRTRFERIACLTSVSNHRGAGILVTTLQALAQATLPAGFIQKVSLSLKVGSSGLSRDELARKLVELGYLRVDPVEDPGTFAVRGDIIDIFIPGHAQPVRVELFGDEVERIRRFDPKTQRSAAESEELKNLMLTPAREVLYLDSDKTRERVKAYADELGISRNQRDPALEAISAKVYPEFSDTWAPFVYSEPGRGWDHLAPGSQFVWVDELGCLANWDQWLSTLERSFNEYKASPSQILPSPQSLYSGSRDWENKIQPASRVYLDLLDLLEMGGAGEPEEADDAAESVRVSTKIRFKIKTNSDLTSASKSGLGELESKFRLWSKQKYRVICLASTDSQAERIRFLLEDKGIHCGIGVPPSAGIISISLGTLSEGLRWPAEQLVVLTESELLGSKRAPRTRKDAASSAAEWSGLQALSDLSPGDAIVHVDHGIGRYQGLVRLDLSGAPSDFLQIEYAQKDRLYLPVYRLNVIQKYAGSGAAVALDRLGSQNFAKTKEKAKESVKKLAVDLVQIYAERAIRPGVVFGARDLEFQDFESRFAFDETPDQLKAIDAILKDLSSGKVMDRLVCGDVGYGKTEVAMRAAFRVASEGKQVIVLVPTTVLAHQHEQSFKARFQGYPIVIDSVSRFKSAKEQKQTLELAKEGKVDILIGTHRLLSRDVKLKDLALIIVDEEHRFGVEHKEKLKTIKTNTHVLTLTATPIPRTLHMALSGLRDISLITTAPVDRLPIRTFLSKYDPATISQAISTELARDGQVFFVHNRVDSIPKVVNDLRDLVPNAKIGVAHGQMGEGELEAAMISFYNKDTNILVCTSIIESGLDLPSANTIVINRADTFGLAQLYQMRGRVGRGQSRAYAYLLIPSEGSVTEDAKKRLEVIQRFVELGSGFSIASHDLEIRGGGDLLGPQQSGHIAAVGFDLYTELLEEAIRELQGKGLPVEQNQREPEIKAPFPAYLPEEYVPDVHQRLALYRRLSSAKNEIEIIQAEEELRDRFGEIPEASHNLLWLIRVKLLLKRLGVDTLTVGKGKVSIVSGPDSRLDPAKAISLVSSQPKIYQLTPDSKLVVVVPTDSLRELFFSLEKLFSGLVPA